MGEESGDWYICQACLPDSTFLLSYVFKQQNKTINDSFLIRWQVYANLVYWRIIRIERGRYRPLHSLTHTNTHPVCYPGSQQFSNYMGALSHCILVGSFHLRAVSSLGVRTISNAFLFSWVPLNTWGYWTCEWELKLQNSLWVMSGLGQFMIAAHLTMCK